MKSLRTKLLQLTLAAILLVGGTMGCGHKDLGFETGFRELRGESRAPRNSIQIAARSECSIFDVNNVVLDFYYGHQSMSNSLATPDGKNICWAMYIDGGIYSFSSPSNDYHDMGGSYFVSEIPYDEFLSESYLYTVSSSFAGGALKYNMLHFSHNETITIPAGVFENGNGEFTVRVVLIQVYVNGDYYLVRNTARRIIQYKYIDEHTISLMSATGFIYS